MALHSELQEFSSLALRSTVLKAIFWPCALMLVAAFPLYIWQSQSKPEVAPLIAAVPTSAKPIPYAKSSVPRPPIRLVGLVKQGNASTALLEINGSRPQLFGVGEVVSQDWKLEEIQAAHVMIGNADHHFRFEVEGGQEVAESKNATAIVAEAPKAVSSAPNEEARAHIQSFQDLVRERTSSPDPQRP